MTTNYIGNKREEYISLLRSMLKESRFDHTLRTEAKALELAALYGEDMGKTQAAALLHDILKNKTKEENAALASKYNIKVEKGSENLLHGYLAAPFIADVLGICDEDILNAVRNHTSGRAGMSRLEKIIYLADLIEDGRDYPSAEHLRNMARVDLDKAVYAACSHTIQYLAATGTPITGGTIELYNDYTINRKEEIL